MPSLNVLLAGSGEGIYFLARHFISKGYLVTVIDPDPEECHRLARELKATVVQGDGGYPQVLEDAGARQMDAVLALTARDQDNLVICQLASLRFQVPRAVALVNDPDNEETFQRLGVATFSTTRVLAGLVGRQVNWDGVSSLQALAGGRINALELAIESGYPAVGRSLQQLRLPQGALVAAVIRESETLVPGGGTILRVGDRIILVTLPENHGPALRAITGENGGAAQ